MSKRMLIYDFDGTLCDTRQAIHETLVETFTVAGVDVPASEIIYKTIGTGAALDEVFTNLSAHNSCLSEHPLDTWKDQYRALYKEIGQTRTTLFPGVAETLEEFAKHELTQIVISNKGRAAIDFSLESLDIRRFITLVMGDQPGVPKKPDPRLYLDHIATKYPDTCPSDTFMVGDSQADLEFAQNAGLIGCWAAYGFGTPQDCENTGYAHRLETFPDLLRVVQNGPKG